MKKTLLAATLVLAIGTMGYAQPQGRGVRDPKKMTEKAAEHLGFTDEQKAQLTELNKKYEGDDYDKTKYREEFRAIMTEEQKKKVDELRRQRGARSGDRQHNIKE